jgi:hypothetical protein
MSLLSRLAVSAARAYGALSSNPNAVSASYLVVAGGGSGGGIFYGGGGGGGGVLSSTASLSTLNTYTITVGAGGASGGTNNGSNSVISGTGLTTITATGGGGGGSNAAGNTGGSGGGGSNFSAGGAGTSGQGFAGGSTPVNNGSGGGGGANAVGSAGSTNTGGAGGAGLTSSITGSSQVYGSGGGGGAAAGGGGAGGTNAGTGATGTGNPTSATANFGGGGGGGGASVDGTAGGSGVVIISYTSATPRFVGGTLTTSGGNQIHTFTSSGTLSPLTPVTASYLVVAGGGGAGSRTGGGGGAGGLLTSSTTLYSGATYIVTVGGGGTGGAGSPGNNGTSGSNSVLSGTGLTTITSTGGGFGTGENLSNAGSGGSGGGLGVGGSTVGTGISGQGFAGGTSNPSFGGGGGGGAGAVGANAVAVTFAPGGIGVASSISGSSTYYAGGGGGGGNSSAGGLGGGGAGGNATGIGVSGTTNLGGGGGGGGASAGTGYAGGAGGSGTVIISYAGSQVFNGGLVTSSGGNTIHTFNATGALTPLTNNLNNSLRFRSSASAYLNRTPSVTGNQKTWTWSSWVKRGTLTTGSPRIFSTQGASAVGANFSTTDTLNIYFGGSAVLTTTQVFRDPSAWYHIVIALDTTQATAANRAKLYINGNQVTAFGTATYPNLNDTFGWNNGSIVHQISASTGDSAYFDGYQTDINAIDGQALEPYYFGNNDAYGNWKPILYKGTYGTNGFYLTFADTSALTTSSNVGLGKDTSGNGNFFATNNISITAGTTYDAMTDVPTNTSATVANYAVMNPLQKSTGVTASGGNLNLSTGGGSVPAKILSTIGMSSGKYYCEMTLLSGSGNYGLATANTSLGGTTYLGDDASSWCYATDGNKYTSGSGAAYGATYTTNDVIGIAFDADAGTLTFYKNNTSQGTAFTGLTSGPYFFAQGASPSTAAVNFGQRPFTYTAPSGFVALNTYNLPTPTVLQGNLYMDATTYSAASPTNRVIVNQALFKPDLVWIKSRSQTYNHYLFDSNRGVGAGALSSNLTSVQNWDTGTQLSSFNSNGYTISSGDAISDTSAVAWQWQAGQGSTSSNTSGSITSTVSVNATAGFSVVTYTGTGANATVGHGLGVAPSMIIVKNRSNGGAGDGAWQVYHTSIGAANYLVLNTTAASAAGSTRWQSTTPTSSVFYIGNTGSVNNTSENYVAYCWAEIAGFSKLGSYTGNGVNGNGPFVFCGFRPKFVLFKNTNTTQDWIIMDTARDSINKMSKWLSANTSGAEYTDANIDVDFVSNGFKIRTSIGTELNGSGNTIIYAAYAENPFKNANAR